MKKAVIEQLVLGMVGTNTWLIKNKESNVKRADCEKGCRQSSLKSTVCLLL